MDDVDFVVYEVISPSLKPSEQLNYLKNTKFNVVQNMLSEELSNNQLSSILVDWRTNYIYDIDGIIVTDDKKYPRISGNPEHSFAFKMVISDQIAEVKVVDVEWSPSKAGYLKPRVRIEPVRLGGVMIEYSTGFNGKFIADNKIGVGAIIEIVRSGDVIPYIKSVVQPAQITKMPSVNYHWNETNVDIVLDNIEDNTTVLEKNITAFFTGLNVEGLSSGNVKRLMNAGYDSISKIVKMTKEDYKTVEGFKEKMINKIHDGIHNKLESSSLVDIMAASNMFGRGIGKRKIIPIMDAYPNILLSEETVEQKIDLLMNVEGIGKENARSFANNINKFLQFITDINLYYKVNNLIPKISSETVNNLIPKISSETVNDNDNDVDTRHPLYNKRVVMTKVRDKYIYERLKTLGGIIDDNFSNKTDILITKSYDDTSVKITKAKAKNIPIFTPADFVKKYDL